MTTPIINRATVTRTELLQRAAALVPALADRAAQAEQQRQIPAATIADFKSAGLMRIGAPDRFGGAGLDCDTIFEAAAELGRGCGSSAWCFAVWSIHNWVMGHFPEQAQEEYFAGSPETLSSSAYNPSGAKATPVDGGYRVSGRWDFSSGCDAAVWATLGALGPTGPLWLLIPSTDYVIDDTWHVAGLRATGSKDIVIEAAFVPAHRVMEIRYLAEAQTVGWELHRRPSYRAPLMTLLPFTLASPVLGMAQGAVESFAAQLSARRTPTGGTMADSVANHLRLAESSAEVDTARLLMRHDYCEILERAARGEMPPPVDRARYRRDHAYMTRLCVRAIDRLFEAAGGHALYDDNPLQRFYRDAHAASHHTALVWDAPAELYGRVVLGLELPPGMRL